MTKHRSLARNLTVPVGAAEATTWLSSTLRTIPPRKGSRYPEGKGVKKLEKTQLWTTKPTYQCLDLNG
jgi:hypothetical protein